MNDENPSFPAQAAPPAPEPPAAAAILEALGNMPDAALLEVVQKGRAILAAREKERRAEALREIQRLAKAHGLAVDVKDPKRKRGRPRKEPEP